MIVECAGRRKGRPAFSMPWGARVLVSRTEREIEAMSQDAYDLRRYIVELHELIDEQSAQTEGGGGHKVVGSPAPWNEQVGSLLMDVHAASRQLADALSAAVGQRKRPRGSTDAGTMIALDACVQLARRLHQLDPKSELPSLAAHRLGMLAYRCREELNCLRPGEERWSRAPADLRCPNVIAERFECGSSLWLAPGWSTVEKPPVYCRSGRPECTLDDGTPYAWPWDAWYRVVTGVAAEHRGTAGRRAVTGVRAAG